MDTRIDPATTHADVIQNWGGPTVYRLIDRASGTARMSLTDGWLDGRPLAHLASPIHAPDCSPLQLGPRPSGDAVPSSAEDRSPVSPCDQP